MVNSTVEPKFAKSRVPIFGFLVIITRQWIFFLTSRLNIQFYYRPLCTSRSNIQTKISKQCFKLTATLNKHTQQTSTAFRCRDKTRFSSSFSSHHHQGHQMRNEGMMWQKLVQVGIACLVLSTSRATNTVVQQLNQRAIMDDGNQWRLWLVYDYDVQYFISDINVTIKHPPSSS